MEDDHEPVTTERPDADPTDDLTDTGQQAVYIGEWLEQCTITNCGPEAAQFLAERGRQIFRRFASKLDALSPAKDILAADKDNASPLLRQRPWNLFESYMCVPGKSDRKRYKDALIDLCASTADTTERVKVDPADQ